MNAAGKIYIWHPSAKDTIKIVYFSDIHWMAKACAEKEVIAQRNEIRDDPNVFWIGGGDYGEFIGFGDAKRFDPDAVADHVTIADLGQLGKKTYDAIGELFDPIKHKCMGLLLGNHEKQYMRRQQQDDLHGYLCTKLGVRNLGYCCMFDIVFCRTNAIKKPVLKDTYPPRGQYTTETFRTWCHHGAGAAQTKGGKINRLTSFMRNFEADIFFMGHIHDQLGARLTPLGADTSCTKLCHRTKLGVVSGSYLKTYAQGVTTYGEQKGYEPVTLGAAWVQIHPETRELIGRV